MVKTYLRVAMKSSILDGKQINKGAEKIPLGPDVLETFAKEDESVGRRTPTLARYREQDVISRRTPDLIRHRELECEYRSLKRDLGIVKTSAHETDQFDVNEDKVLSEKGVKVVSTGENPKARTFDHGRQFNSHDFLLSKNLAMDHFEKHIMNIKMNCKRYNKTVKQKSDKNKTSPRKIKTKFKPVFEQVD